MSSIRNAYFDTSQTGLFLSISGGFTDLLPAPGNFGTEPVFGESIRVKKLELKAGAILGNPASTGNIIRLIIFMDHQSNGAQPTTSGDPSGLLEDAAGGLFFNCFPRESNMHRYSILHDEMIDLQLYDSAVGAQVYSIDREWCWEESGINLPPSVYNGGLSIPTTNNLGLFLCSFSTNTPEMWLRTRVTYETLRPRSIT